MGGLALFVFGLATFAWPPLRAIAVLVVTLPLGGLALMMLPTLVAVNELLILGGVGVAVVAWFLAHRHGHLRGLVEGNRNGVDDRVEGALPGMAADEGANELAT